MYRFLKIQNFCESDDNHNEEQKDGCTRRYQNHKMRGESKKM